MKHIAYSKDALRSLRRMPSNMARTIRDKIELDAASPKALANNIVKLQGSGNALRMRVGDWRVIFTENLEVLAIIKIAPRGSVYE